MWLCNIGCVLFRVGGKSSIDFKKFSFLLPIKMLDIGHSCVINVVGSCWNMMCTSMKAISTLHVAKWCHMVTEIWVNNGLGNGLLPGGTKPLPKPQCWLNIYGLYYFLHILYVHCWFCIKQGWGGVHLNKSYMILWSWFWVWFQLKKSASWLHLVWWRFTKWNFILTWSTFHTYKWWCTIKIQVIDLQHAYLQVMNGCQLGKWTSHDFLLKLQVTGSYRIPNCILWNWLILYILQSGAIISWPTDQDITYSTAMTAAEPKY